MIAKRFTKRVFSQNGEDLLLARILFRDFGLDKSKLKGKYYCEVGSFHPFEHSNSALFRGLGIKGLHVDPSRQTGKEFQLLAPRQTFLLGFAGQGKSMTKELFVPSRTFADSNLAGTSSLSHDEDYVSKGFRPVVDVSEALKRMNISELLFLSIDVEGSELEFLESFDFSYAPLVVLVEIHFEHISDITNSEIYSLLVENGYRWRGQTGPTAFFSRRAERTLEHFVD